MAHLGLRNLFLSGPWSSVHCSMVRSSTLGLIMKSVYKFSSINTPSMYVFDRTSKKIQRVRVVKYICLSLNLSDEETSLCVFHPVTLLLL